MCDDAVVFCLLTMSLAEVTGRRMHAPSSVPTANCHSSLGFRDRLLVGLHHPFVKFPEHLVDRCGVVICSTPRRLRKSYRRVTEYGYVLPGPGPRPRSAPRLAALIAAGVRTGRIWTAQARPKGQHG